MPNLKALIVGFFTAVVVIILLSIKIRDRLNRKKQSKEKKEKSKQRFKKKKIDQNHAIFKSPPTNTQYSDPPTFALTRLL